MLSSLAVPFSPIPSVFPAVVPVSSGAAAVSFFFRRKLHKTGVTVSATSVDAARAVMNAMPSGFSIRPSMPERKKSGMKLAMIISVE